MTPLAGMAVARSVVARWRAFVAERKACPMLDLIHRHPDLFQKEVLERLDPADRALLGQVDSSCRAAVVASDLPCAGTRVGMRQRNPADRARLDRAVRAFTPNMVYTPRMGYTS